MNGKNPGAWIAAAIVLAVVIVALSVPNKPALLPQEEVPVATTAKTPSDPPQLAKSPRVPDGTGAPAPAPVVSTPASQPSPAPVPGVAANRAPIPTIAPDPVPVIPAPGTKEAPPAPRNVPRDEAIQAVDNVHFALRDYRSALGENPEGSNEEITKALMGDNLKQVRINLPDGSQVSKSGELCDPWGTPYFFHQLSKQKMEIRSAGPDLKMWTSDDIQM